MVRGEISLPKHFSLGLTLLCGQCFRWEGPDAHGRFEGVAGDVFWRLQQEHQQLHWECSSGRIQEKTPEEWLTRYFCLDDDIKDWMDASERDPVLELPVKLLRGLRLLRQDPWECTVSYMFAQGLS